MAITLSLTLPGLGHMHLRRPVLGIVEMLIGAGLLIAGLSDLVATFLNAAEGTVPLAPVFRVLMRWAPILIGYCLLSGAFTWLVSRHDCVARGEPPSSR